MVVNVFTGGGNGHPDDDDKYNHIIKSNLVYPDTARLKFFVFSSQKYSESDAKSDLNNKLEVLKKKVTDYFKDTIATVTWPSISSSNYDCDEKSDKYICSIITPFILIKSIHFPAPKNFQD